MSIWLPHGTAHGHTEARPLVGDSPGGERGALASKSSGTVFIKTLKTSSLPWDYRLGVIGWAWTLPRSLPVPPPLPSHSAISPPVQPTLQLADVEDVRFPQLDFLLSPFQILLCCYPVMETAEITLERKPAGSLV